MAHRAAVLIVRLPALVSILRCPIVITPIFPVIFTIFLMMATHLVVEVAVV